MKSQPVFKSYHVAANGEGFTGCHYTRLCLSTKPLATKLPTHGPVFFFKLSTWLQLPKVRSKTKPSDGTFLHQGLWTNLFNIILKHLSENDSNSQNTLFRWHVVHSACLQSHCDMLFHHKKSCFIPLHDIKCT